MTLLRQLREPVWGTETSERLLMGRAADEIESLTAERDRLREALEPFVAAAKYLPKSWEDHEDHWYMCSGLPAITVAHLREAREAYDEGA